MADDAIALFCAYLQRRNYSPHTVDNYGRDLRLFFALVAKDPCTVSGRDVTVFIEHQRAAQRTATTINRRLNAVQHFFAYLATDRQTLGSNPVVAYLGLADNSRGPLLSCLRGLSPPVVRSRNRLSAPYATLLSCLSTHRSRAVGRSFS